MNKNSQNLPYALKMRKLQEQKKTKLSLKQKNILAVFSSFLFLSFVGWYLVIFSGLNIVLPLLISISTILLFFQFKKVSIKNRPFLNTYKKSNRFVDYRIETKTVKKSNKKINSFSSVPKPLYSKSQNITNPIPKPLNQNSLDKTVENAIKIIKSSKKLPKTSPFLTKKQSNKIDKNITILSKSKKVVNK